ncbi:MAG TPA: hypothetical protein VNM48_03155, partial [Chloroflexota bacterium]|nr:hypothetical protein [Chloroflexota bacterium]
MNRKTQLGTAMRSALLTCAVAAAATLAAPAAFAAYIGNTTGGVGCNQASGSGNLFYFTNLSAQNVTATGQFLSCLYIDINRGVAPLDADATNVQV